MSKSILFVTACVLVGVAAWLVLAKPTATTLAVGAPSTAESEAARTDAAKAASRAMTFTRPLEPMK